MLGIDLEVTCHKLNVDKLAKPVIQRARGPTLMHVEAVEEEVDGLLEPRAIREVNYPTWLSNTVKEEMIIKEQGMLTSANSRHFSEAKKSNMLHRATKNPMYLQYIQVSCQTLGVDESDNTFGWDNKHVGARILLSKVDYLLGDNPLKMSYMVGYGPRYPLRIHHRGSSLPSITTRTGKIQCSSGFSIMNSQSPNPNILVGAVVGGLDQNDRFPDQWSGYEQSEPATYINAPLVGALCYLAHSFGQL
ncbi:hypothetical protein HYC85_024837 [Camellia sinensis]|uniref:Endoglucanase n=1 Tax=Camellia sinensis TaxID=4442 RepID=A0A7J7GBL8_CAMSI|nr:hypothetical protein HYC85_024837 [Camellia sinensis]